MELWCHSVRRSLDILVSLLYAGRNWTFLFVQLIYLFMPWTWGSFFFHLQCGKWQDSLSALFNSKVLLLLQPSSPDRRRLSKLLHHRTGFYFLGLRLAVIAGCTFSVLINWMWIFFSELNPKLYLHWWPILVCTKWSWKFWLSWSETNSHESWSHWNLCQITQTWNSNISGLIWTTGPDPGFQNMEKCRRAGSNLLCRMCMIC